jgi:hypothetical protein
MLFARRDIVQVRRHRACLMMGRACLMMGEMVGVVGGHLAELDAEDVALLPELGGQAPQQVREVRTLTQRVVEIARLILFPEPERAARLPCGRPVSADYGGGGERSRRGGVQCQGESKSCGVGVGRGESA